MSIRWVGSVSCEGGPVMVASLSAFTHWPGGRPLPKTERTSLHLWGQFTPELPERFRPEGNGHQWLRGDLKALWGDLMDTLEARWPNADWGMDPDLLRAQMTRSDGASLWMELAPVSEYERCWQGAQSRGENEAWLHTWDDQRASFWEIEGPGVVEVGETADGLVLLRTWTDDDDQLEAARAAAASCTPTWMGELVLSGRAVVAWAQVDGAELDPKTRAGTAIDGPGVEGLGYVAAVRSGRYRVGVADLEAEGWSGRCLRLQRITEAG